MTEKEFLELYYQGFSDTKIAKIYNKERHSIHKIRKQLGLPRANFTTLYKDIIVELVAKGYSDIRIANNLNISKSMVGYIRKKLNIKTNFIERLYKNQEDRIKGYMIRQIKSSAKIRNIFFDLSYEDIIFPRYCPLLEIELQYNPKKLNDLFFFFLDRIDNSKGYIKGNILVMSRQANAMKNCASFEELTLFCKNIIKIIDFVKNQGALGDITDIFFNKEELNLDL